MFGGFKALIFWKLFPSKNCIGLKNSELLKNGKNRDLNSQSETQTKNGSLAPTRSTSSPNFARINRFPVPININGSPVSKRSNDSPIPFIGDNSPRSNLSVASSSVSQSYAYPIPIRETDSPESLRYIPQGPSRVGGLNSNYLHSIHPSEFPLPYYPPSPEFQSFHPGFVPGAYAPVYLYPTHGALTSSPIHPLNTLQQYPREAEPSPQYSTPLRPQDITDGLNENPDFSKLGENYKNPRKIVFVNNLLINSNTECPSKQENLKTNCWIVLNLLQVFFMTKFSNARTDYLLMNRPGKLGS